LTVKNSDYGANMPDSQYQAKSAQKWHNMTLSCIEMKSKTILILNGRNGKRDTI
jgi:uridine phosphorylase